MEQEHVIDRLTEYVLGALPQDEQRRVTIHAAQCASCRAALQRERQLERLVQQTVQAATRPDQMRLATLRPTVGKSRRSAFARPVYSQLAPITALLLLILGMLSMQIGNGRYRYDEAPAFGPSRPSPTVTETPTATIVYASTLPPAPTAAPATARPYTPEPSTSPDAAAPDPTIGGQPPPTPVALASTMGTN